MLRNGDFSRDLAGWTLESIRSRRRRSRRADRGDAARFAGVKGLKRVRIETTKPGQEAWHVQLNQRG